MPLKSDDIFVASFPRSGTTWTQELVWLLANDLDYTKAAAIPLSARYIFLELSMFMSKSLQEELLKHNFGNEEVIKVIKLMGTPGTQLVARKPSPRFIKTHLPMTLLPPTLLDSTKVVYVARDPRDVAVSYFHHSKLFKAGPFSGDFKTYWSYFIRGMVPCSPYFEHIKEAWQMRNHPNMLFLFYEELSKDLPATVRRVADFLGKQYSDEQNEGLCSHLKFDNFKKNPSVNMDELKHLGMLSKNESFIRKGKSGGWPEYFDEDMTKEAERWISDNLRNTDLRFPSK
ncbi:unnamed protein product, partial [Iphiclides podalirius]